MTAALGFLAVVFGVVALWQLWALRRTLAARRRLHAEYERLLAAEQARHEPTQTLNYASSPSVAPAGPEKEPK